MNGYGNFNSTPNNFMSIGNYGQLGTGTFDPEVTDYFSQPVAQPSWAAPYSSPAPAMNSLPSINDMTKPSFLGGMLGKNGQQGWGGLALGAIQGGLGAFIGMKQYGLAKKQFQFQKDAWNKEYEVNKNLTNERLITRNDRRIAESGITGMKTEDTATVLSKYGVK